MAAIDATQVTRERRASWILYLRALLRDKVIFLAAAFLVLLVAAVVLAPLVFPHDPTQQNLALRNSPPFTSSAESGFPHVFGTDQLGRDILARLLAAGRVSLAVGFLGVIVSGTAGVLLGLVAGFYRGRTDDAIMRIVDLQMAVPFLLLALLYLFLFGTGFANVIIVLAISRWPIYARVTRSMTFSLREETFVEAARTLGCSNRRIVLRHILPNQLAPLLVLGTLEIARLILAEATLSFLGLGIQPPDSSWGLMVAQGREFLTAAAWNVYMPGLFIFFTALSLNLLATWLRSITDPLQRAQWLVRSERADVAQQVQEGNVGGI